MKVGASRVEITPPAGLAMDGYGARASGAIDAHDPLHVRVIAAEDEAGTSVAIVVADLLHVGPRLGAAIAAHLLASTRIVRDHLQLVGTHTHSGPAFDEPSDAETMIAERIAEAVGQAWAARRPARAAIGVGAVTGIGKNRRPNGGPVDDRVTVCRFDDEGGAPIATLVNYGCHPTTLGPDNLRYSADYPGVACRVLDERIGGVSVFTTGPQGDVNPGGYSPEGSMIGIVAPWRTYASAERYGGLIADTAAGVHASLGASDDTPGANGEAARVWAAAETL